MKMLLLTPFAIFQRAAIPKNDNEDLVNFLRFELALFLLGLFDEGGIRKTKKSSMYKLFPSTGTTIDSSSKTVMVVDGGFLLQLVK